MSSPDAEFLSWALKGNREAIDFVMHLGFLGQVWDDFYDCDKPVPPETVEKSLWLAMVEVPCNGFYQRHFAVLQAAVRESIMGWITANTLERGDGQDRTIAWALRDANIALTEQAAYLIGGYEWARDVAVAARRKFHDETVEEYQKSLGRR